MKLCAALSVKNSVEAVAFYQEAFGMTLGFHGRNPDGSYGHAELEKDGKYIFEVAESDNEANQELVDRMKASPYPIMSYNIDFSTEDEIRKAYGMLAEDGHVIRPLGPLPWSPLAANVVDKYGVYWYITFPQHRPADEDMAEFLGDTHP